MVVGAGGCQEWLAAGGAALAAGLNDEGQRGILNGAMDRSIRVMVHEQIGVIAVWERQ